jgi:hypothetical protein
MSDGRAEEGKSVVDGARVHRVHIVHNLFPIMYHS